jgi:hypothetical protein
LLTDDNAKFTALKLGKIPFIADASLDKPQASFNKFLKGTLPYSVSSSR